MDEAPWTVRRLLEWTQPFFTRKEVDSPRLSAELLLSHVLGIPRIRLYTDYERPLTEIELTRYRDLVRQAAEHKPIAYLTGRAFFFNLELEVSPAVLIPRPETETLVENVLQAARHEGGLESARVLDLCTGSGCIAAAIAAHLKNAQVTAVDLSSQAVEIARKNIQKLKLDDRVSVLEGDLFAALKNEVDRHPFDLLTANPPYIASDKIASLDRNVRDYEPKIALDGGPDGLDIVRRILAEGAPFVRAGGRVYIEIAFDEGPAALRVAGEYPAFVQSRILRDHGGRDRVLSLRRAGASTPNDLA